MTYDLGSIYLLAGSLKYRLVYWIKIYSRMGCKAVLFVAVSLVIFCAVETTDLQQQNMKGKIVDPTSASATKAEMYQLLMNLEKRCVLKNVENIYS